jgi:hypothetical protein
MDWKPGIWFELSLKDSQETSKQRQVNVPLRHRRGCGNLQSQAKQSKLP